MDLYTPQLLLFKPCEAAPYYLPFVPLLLTYFFALHCRGKTHRKNIELHKMQLNPLFKCQGLEVRRGRSKFHLFSCVLSTQKLPMKWSTSGFMSGWWEAGSVSWYLGKQECRRVRYVQQRCSTLQVFFFWEKRYYTSSFECTYNLILY